MFMENTKLIHKFMKHKKKFSIGLWSLSSLNIGMKISHSSIIEKSFGKTWTTKKIMRENLATTIAFIRESDDIDIMK